MISDSVIWAFSFGSKHLFATDLLYNSGRIAFNRYTASVTSPSEMQFTPFLALSSVWTQCGIIDPKKNPHRILCGNLVKSILKNQLQCSLCLASLGVRHLFYARSIMFNPKNGRKLKMSFWRQKVYKLVKGTRPNIHLPCSSRWNYLQSVCSLFKYCRKLSILWF